MTSINWPFDYKIHHGVVGMTLIRHEVLASAFLKLSSEMTKVM